MVQIVKEAALNPIEKSAECLLLPAVCQIIISSLQLPKYRICMCALKIIFLMLILGRLVPF